MTGTIMLFKNNDLATLSLFVDLHSSVPVAWGFPRRLYGTSPANPYQGLAGSPLEV
jgi:hypothetical protein